MGMIKRSMIVIRNKIVCEERSRKVGEMKSGSGNYITSKRGICTGDKGMSEQSTKRGMICERGGKHWVDFCFYLDWFTV